MKPTVTEVLRRGFDNARANWPLLLFRFAESVLFVFLIIGSIAAIIVPVLISAGISKYNASNAADAAEAFLDFFYAHGMIIAYVLAVITIVGFVLMAIHSFVVGGLARVLVDAEHSAELHQFTVDRWFAGGRETWWPIFWIYNLAYGLAALIVCVPLILVMTVFAAAIIRESVPSAIATGCIGFPIVIFLTIFCSIIAAVWSQKAIVVCVEQHRAANDSLRVAWREARADFSRHFGVAFVMFVIAIGGSGAISMVSLMFSVPSMPHGPAALLGLVFLPARVVVGMISSLFSSAVALWSLASFAALSEKR